jgi:hypothetical protein
MRKMLSSVAPTPVRVRGLGSKIQSKKTPQLRFRVLLTEDAPEMELAWSSG